MSEEPTEKGRKFQPNPTQPIVHGIGGSSEPESTGVIRSLFTKADFISHSGIRLSWRIDADALTPADREAIDSFVGTKLRFRAVNGIPRGGLAFAEALRPYAGVEGGLLIVDDVLTTGGSMEEARSRFAGDQPIRGVVLFSRDSSCPDWITPIFELNPRFFEVARPLPKSARNSLA